ncbi:MAG: hypothetical protein AAFW98_21280, partial [Pseudomonadota bacterium]
MSLSGTRLVPGGAWRPGRHRGVLVAFAALVASILTVDLISPGPMSYFEVSFLSSGGATLALAA